MEARARKGMFQHEHRLPCTLRTTCFGCPADPRELQRTMKNKGSVASELLNGDQQAPPPPPPHCTLTVSINLCDTLAGAYCSALPSPEARDNSPNQTRVCRPPPRPATRIFSREKQNGAEGGQEYIAMSRKIPFPKSLPLSRTDKTHDHPCLLQYLARSNPYDFRMAAKT